MKVGTRKGAEEEVVWKSGRNISWEKSLNLGQEN